MSKLGIDQDALIDLFAQASAKQGEAVRKAVNDATLQALQGRELTMKNIKAAVKTITEAASTGAAKNIAPPMDVEALLGKALAGMDAALLQAVEANRKALEQFVAQGVSLQEKGLKTAMADLEKMEDTFYATVSKAAESAGGAQMQGPWTQVLDAMKIKGSATGGGASAAVQKLMADTQSAVRASRASGMKAAQALVDSYTALVSGVLIGMSQGLQGQAAAAPAPAAAAKRPRAK
jgi:hypothetical protein